MQHELFLPLKSSSSKLIRTGSRCKFQLTNCLGSQCCFLYFISENDILLCMLEANTKGTLRRHQREGVVFPTMKWKLHEYSPNTAPLYLLYCQCVQRKIYSPARCISQFIVGLVINIYPKYANREKGTLEERMFLARMRKQITWKIYSMIFFFSNDHSDIHNSTLVIISIKTLAMKNFAFIFRNVLLWHPVFSLFFSRLY